MRFQSFSLISFVPCVLGRNIIFPPVVHSGFQDTQFALADHGDIDNVDITTGSQFHGLTTFANLPYVNCFVDSESKDQKYDIAILGAPFDTVHTIRKRHSHLIVFFLCNAC